MKARVPRIVYVALFIYIAISLTYQLSSTVSLITGFFDLRKQVDEFPFSVEDYTHRITKVSGAAEKQGMAPGDLLASLNGVPFTGRTVLQSVRWYAHPGDTLLVDIRKPDGSHATLGIPLVGYKDRPSPGESIFVMALQLVMPAMCLFLGYWVVIARPTDPHAWLILVLLTYPQSYVSVSTFNFWPGIWLTLRLYWHLAMIAVTPATLLAFGLLFPERSVIDKRAPWLKWLVTCLTAFALVEAFLAEYSAWYDGSFFTGRRPFDAISDGIINWLALVCVVLYWIAIFAKLRTASTADNRRRLQVLCAGSVIGLGSTLIAWGILPRFGASPAEILWLGYLSAILMLVFPLSLAYVLVVQRAMDVSILVRMGTRYALARGTVFLVQFAVIVLLLFWFVIPLLQRKNDRALAIIVPVIVFALLIRLQFVKRTLGDRAREWVDRKFFRDAFDTERVLGELAVHVRSIADPATMIQTISTRISDILHVPQMAVMLRNGNGFQLQSSAGIFLPASSLPVRYLVQTGAPAVLYRDRPETWFEEAHDDERRTLTELNAEVLLPLTGRNRLMGVMVLGPKRSEEPYSPSDLRLLASIGAQAGLGLEISELAKSLADEASRHQRVQREVEIAREVQQRLFPEIPVVPGMDIAGHCRPALGVGGDYYDVVPLEDGRLVFAIGDVSGKGIAAALLMASLRASLRGIVDTNSHDLARIVAKLNRLVHESSTANRYATFFFAIYDPATMRLHYVNAGHNAPLVLRQNEAIRLEACGPVVGLLKDVEYEEASLQMATGDLFIGYTDGISEAMTVDDEEWGEERMQSEVRGVFDRPVEEILTVVFQGADDFAAGAPQYDDMTLLIWRLR